MQIAPEYLDKLRVAGLLISQPFPSIHVAFPDGVAVAKPTNVRGNGIPGYSAIFDDENTSADAPITDVPSTDAPSVILFCKEGNWYVEAMEYYPGPGPGDFLDQWATPEEAVADVLEFFFGDPARMNAKAE